MKLTSEQKERLKFLQKVEKRVIKLVDRIFEPIDSKRFSNKFKRIYHIQTKETLLELILPQVEKYKKIYPIEIIDDNIESIRKHLYAMNNAQMIKTSSFCIDNDDIILKEYENNKNIDKKFHDIMKSLETLQYICFYFEINERYVVDILYYYLISFDDEEMLEQLDVMEEIFDRNYNSCYN